MKKVILLVLVVLAVGCTTSRPPIDMGGGRYMAAKQGAGFWVSTLELKQQLYIEAIETCAALGKQLGEWEGQTKEQIPLGQAGGPRFPSADMQFTCI